jgi:adenylate cyclase
VDAATKKALADDEGLYAGAQGDEERQARRELLEQLAKDGATKEDMTAAVRDGTLSTLPLEFALAGDRRYTLTEVARKTRLESPYLRQVLLSLGHANPRPRERAFTDDDLDMARVLRAFLDAGLNKDGLLEVARVLGQSTARTASVIREVAGNALIEPGDTEATLGMRYAEAAQELVPMLGPILEYELRVHLREQATREVITRAERASGELSGTSNVAVAFVDLSGFTQIGNFSSAQGLAAIGCRLAALAAEAARPPVELVKTMGDGAMFVSTDVDALVTQVCALSESVAAEGDGFPDLRGGLAFGPAANRGADWYGPSVNSASRIVDVAKPSTILADEGIRERAGDGFEWSRRRMLQGLKGVEGRPKLYRLVD